MIEDLRYGGDDLVAVAPPDRDVVLGSPSQHRVVDEPLDARVPCQQAFPNREQRFGVGQAAQQRVRIPCIDGRNGRRQRQDEQQDGRDPKQACRPDRDEPDHSRTRQKQVQRGRKRQTGDEPQKRTPGAGQGDCPQTEQRGSSPEAPAGPEHGKTSAPGLPRIPSVGPPVVFFSCGSWSPVRAGDGNERPNQESQRDRDVHPEVCAQEDRTPQRGRDPRRVRCVDQPDAVVFGDGHQGRRQAGGQVEGQKNAPVPAGSEHGRQNDRQRKPVGLVDDTLHPLVVGPEAPLNADPEACREHRDAEGRGKQDQYPGARRPPGWLEQGQQHPGNEYDFDQ